MREGFFLFELALIIFCLSVVFIYFILEHKNPKLYNYLMGWRILPKSHIGLCLWFAVLLIVYAVLTEL